MKLVYLLGALIITNIALTRPLPSKQVRKSIIKELAQEMKRLDGDGLLPRKNREERWDTTVKRLVREAGKAYTKW